MTGRAQPASYLLLLVPNLILPPDTSGESRNTRPCPPCHERCFSTADTPSPPSDWGSSSPSPETRPTTQCFRHSSWDTGMWTQHRYMGMRRTWGEQCVTRASPAPSSSSPQSCGAVDLLLLHCPGESAPRAETWRALEEAVTKGEAKSIGVSNFGIPHLEKLMTTASIKPAVNQIELSPFSQRTDVVQYCKAQGITLQAYSPLAKATKLDDPRLTALAAKRGITTAQLLIRWSLQHGFIPLPKSVNPARQATNLDVFGFELSPEEMAELGGMEEGLCTGWDPIANDPV